MTHFKTKPSLCAGVCVKGIVREESVLDIGHASPIMYDPVNLKGFILTLADWW